MYLVPLAKVSTECLPASHQPYEGEGALAVRGVLAACEVVMGHLGGGKMAITITIRFAIECT